jgi:hypothetical protein
MKPIELAHGQHRRAGEAPRFEGAHDFHKYSPEGAVARE